MDLIRPIVNGGIYDGYRLSVKAMEFDSQDFIATLGQRLNLSPQFTNYDSQDFQVTYAQRMDLPSAEYETAT